MGIGPANPSISLAAKRKWMEMGITRSGNKAASRLNFKTQFQNVIKFVYKQILVWDTRTSICL